MASSSVIFGNRCRALMTAAKSYTTAATGDAAAKPKRVPEFRAPLHPSFPPPFLPSFPPPLHPSFPPHRPVTAAPAAPVCAKFAQLVREFRAFRAPLQFAQLNVVSEASGYWCEGCQKNDDACNLRYIMVVKVSDASGEAYLSVFNEQAERIIGCTADELNEKRQRITIRAVAAIDYATESKYLAEEISKMKLSK